MAKFYGVIGFEVNQAMVSPGVYQKEIVEKTYRGDMLRNKNRIRNDDQINQDIIFDNRLSIISDPFANINFPQIRYVVLNGSKWKVMNAEIQRPRIILTIGGLYNE